ncbi:MAG: hypothetical protein HQK89_02250 [Nitrospirae bacterium]|nr:hypothetical protein [Nitrospirota bacterium]
MTRKRQLEGRITVSFRLSPELIKSLKYHAVNKDVNLTDFVEGVLVEYVKTHPLQIDASLKTQSSVEAPAKDTLFSVPATLPASVSVERKEAPSTSTLATWQALFNEWQETGLSKVEFATKKGINHNTLRSWFSKLKSAKESHQEENDTESME